MPHSPEDKKRILTRVRRIRARLMPLNAPWNRAIPVSPFCSKLPPCAALPMA